MIMEMKEIHWNNAYKVLHVTLNKGEEMPHHFASSHAFLIVGNGKGKLQLPDREVALEAGTTLHIPAKAPHSLQVLEDFRSFVVLSADAQIEFTAA